MTLAFTFRSLPVYDHLFVIILRCKAAELRADGADRPDHPLQNVLIKLMDKRQVGPVRLMNLPNVV